MIINFLQQIQSNQSSSQPSSSKPNQAPHRSNPNHLYMHQDHYHHHSCYHYYDELELAATKACAAMLTCDDSLDLFTGKGSPVFTWLAQLLENAHVEMKMYDYCKCTLPNEIYTLTLTVCVQLFELSLYHVTSNLAAAVLDSLLQKCFSAGVSQDIADLCFLALAKVIVSNANTKSSLEYSNIGAFISLILLNLGSPKLNLHETSVAVLKVLSHKYLEGAPPPDTGVIIVSKTSTVSPSSIPSSNCKFLNKKMT